MPRHLRFALMVLAIVFSGSPLISFLIPAFATDTLSLTPNSPQIVAGHQLQFSARSSSGTPLNWFACSGSVDNNGLYTAPVYEHPTTSCVVVTSDANPGRGTVQFVTILPPNGPPTYQWAYAGNTKIPTPATAPFTVTDPAGTIKTDSTLSPNAHIVRLTDANTGCRVYYNSKSQGPGSFLSTPGGGAEDVITNSTETIVQAKCSGSTSYVVGLNPRTLQVLGHSGVVCSGTFTFSQSEDNVAYCRPGSNTKITVNGANVTANGMQVYALTFPYNSSLNCGHATCPDVTQPPTWSLVVDLTKVCAQVPAGNPTWTSTLSVEAADTMINLAASWVGGQDTAHLNFTYIAGQGCQTIDTVGNGVSPLWYRSQTSAPEIVINGLTGQPLQASWSTIHNTVANAEWINIVHQACTGVDCGLALWKVGTNMMVLHKWTGHKSLGQSYFFNDSWPQDAHPFSNLTQTYHLGWFQVPGCPTCRDDHFQADRLNDSNPNVGTSGGAGGEVYALDVSVPPSASIGSVNVGGNKRWRFVKTYTSGIVSQNNFWAQYAIGAPGQKRTIFCWATDMLGQLGTLPYANPLNRSDEFCVGLAGQ
jgi:hypothetical protein